VGQARKAKERRTMYVSQRDLNVRREQCKDLLREAEQERLAGAIKGPVWIGTGLLRKVVDWFSAPRADVDLAPPPPTLTPAPGK
jgi:hypothetical protein